MQTHLPFFCTGSIATFQDLIQQREFLNKICCAEKFVCAKKYVRLIILLRYHSVRLFNISALFALIWICAENCFCAFLKRSLWKMRFSAVGRLEMRNHPIDFQCICLRQNFMERTYAFAHENLFALYIFFVCIFINVSFSDQILSSAYKFSDYMQQELLRLAEMEKFYQALISNVSKIAVFKKASQTVWDRILNSKTKNFLAIFPTFFTEL